MAELSSKQQKYINKQPRFGDKLIMDLEYEPLYDYIKTDRNYIWEYYQEQINQLVASTVVRYQLPYDELYSDAWIYFNKALDKYKPMYNNNFYPLQNYLLNFMYLNFRGNIQSQFKRANRELLESNNNNDIDGTMENVFIERETCVLDDERLFNSELLNIINKFPEKYCTAIKLSLIGKKQHEIAKELGLTQSRISLMFKKIKDSKSDLYCRMGNESSELYNYCHNL